MYNRPKIDTENLVDSRLKPEEYDTALNYIKKLQTKYINGKIENSNDVNSLNWLEVFETGKEMYSFLDTLPKKDIASLMKEITLGTLDDELEG